MQESAYFFRFGEAIYRHKMTIVIVWLIIILSSLPFLPQVVSPFKSTGLVNDHSISAKADNFLKKSLPFYGPKLLVLYKSSTISTKNPLFLAEITASLKKLESLDLPYKITYPSRSNAYLYGQNHHAAYVIISFKADAHLSDEKLIELKNLIQPAQHMKLFLGGEPVFIQNTNQQTQQDLVKADMIAIPVTILVLLLIFKTLIASSIPLLLGGSCAVLMLVTLFVLAQCFSLSIYTLNIALLLGLCLTLDYCLFLISRFREELTTSASIKHALAMTQASAGKAIFFSGLAVFASLSALFIFPINMLFSVGVGGIVAVSIALLLSLTLLPALLGLIGLRINHFSLLPVHLFNLRHLHFWRTMATKVTYRPLSFFVVVLIFLLCLGYPFTRVNPGISDLGVLPKHSNSRQFFDEFQHSFAVNTLTPLTLVVHTRKPLLSRASLKSLVQLNQSLKRHPFVLKVNNIVALNQALNAKDYYHLYKQPDKHLNKLLKQTSGRYFTVFTLISRFPMGSAQTNALIEDIRHMQLDSNVRIELTGTPVNNYDVMQTIKAYFPYALVWVMLFSYVILLILLRSLFLPFKAILMNALSLCASYGVLVLIFQEGHLHQWLHFEPQGMLDMSLLIIIFCALFGFSMDYEVFLLSRIREYYLQTKDNTLSVIYGIEHSSKIITSAAMIVIVLCGSFMVADVLMVKEFGLGIAVAIFVDAFLIRILLVPSTMTLVKSWNWYLPKWLDKYLPYF
ncbi:MAG: hypothetical protein CMF38_05570 [Legionellaceae bacterium]|nr:hypothetical protein [Legionellaceae bacterium]HAF87572.1 MMPL family transporter [Legionellales bacterium]|tara:strand:+ start:1609 stop:3822 length:2214 start_codon:yes stop_codon:yes gene_type:complete